MTLYGIDISNNQGPNISMQEVKNEGFAWVEAKVSEGNYFQDSTWPGYRDAANACGLAIIGYHYAISSCSPASQVQAFVNNGGGKSVMIDFEANSGSISDYWNLVNAFNAAGVEVVLTYIPRWYWSGSMGGGDLSKVPGLVSSSYFGTGSPASTLYNNAGGDGGNGWNVYGGGTPSVWQFTDGALVAGYSVDANAFKGTQDQLNTLLGLAPPPNAINDYAAANTWLGTRTTAGENVCPDGVGRYAEFACGYVYWTPTTGAHGIPTSIFTKWATLGWEAGVLGYPVADASTLTEGGGQAFQNGFIYQLTGQDAFYIHGAIGDRWVSDGCDKSPEGWPTSDEYAYDGARAQNFQNGTLYWNPNNVVYVPK
jgi:lysozyme